jgi:glutamate--cysteine ligase
MLPFVFEEGFGYERYCDYMLDVPMYFVYRDGKYIDVAGRSFRDFLEGKLPELPGEKPRLTDWTDHLSNRFSRSSAEELSRDARRRRRAVEQDLRAPALWVGPALRPGGARRGVGPRQSLGHRRARAAPPRGAEARAGRHHAGRLVDARTRGARARHFRRRPDPSGRLNSAGDNEGGFLDPLREVVATGMTPPIACFDNS